MAPAGRLGLGLAIALVAGNMIGSGIYLLPASLAGIGSSALVGWGVALFGALLFGGVFSLLALRLSASEGGVLEQVRDVLGLPVGYVTACLYWVNCVVGNIAIALAVTGYAGALIPALTGSAMATAATTIAVLWLIIAANLAGPRFVARFEAGTLAIGLLPILAVGILGWFWFDIHQFEAAWNPAGTPLSEGLPNAVLTVFWAFLGLESIMMVSALVDNPRRNIPLATLGGIALAGAVYIGACAAMMGIIPLSDLADSTAPFADTTALMFGTTTGGLVALCAALKASGTLGGWILLTSRTLPGHAGVSHIAPARIMVTSGVFMSLAVVATSSPTIAEQFTLLTNAAVVLTLIVYVVASVALVRIEPAPAVRLLALGAIGFALWIVALSGSALLLWSAAILAGSVILFLIASRLRRSGGNTPAEPFPRVEGHQPD
jgi:arginine:agmatine antiporter